MRFYHPLKRGLASLLLVALVAAPVASAGSMPLPPVEATSSITARDLKKHLSFLASDELGGRYTFSASNRIAARYLASELESYGYRGAARDGSFFQKVPLSYRSVDFSSSHVTLSLGGAKQTFKYGDGFLVLPPTDLDFSGELVFVGYGISSPKNNYDDYAGLEVKGKIIVAMSGAPEALRSVRLGEDEMAEMAALAHGAVGAIILPEPAALLTWNETKNFFMSQQEMGLPPHGAARSGRVFPSITAGPELIKAVAKAMGTDSSSLMSATGKSVKPAAIAATAAVRMKVEAKPAPPAQNVVGVLEGSDPKLKQEYVVFSAHYDHLKTSDSGEVYNGADDDGSGTVSVLEIAQAFAMKRPSRSVLIVFHTGEELGLFGSEFNTDYEPVVPLEKLVADFNIDMVGRSRPEDDNDPLDKMLTDKDSIYIIGADKLSTELNQISEETNAETARLHFDYTYNDERHPERFYYRSDHYNYAKHGIPIIFYFTGVHRDYHKPTDDVDKIDFQKMERIDRMIFATGWRVANLDHRLVVDKKPASQPAQ